MDTQEEDEQWQDITQVLDEEAQNPDIQSIDLDCPPGKLRPGDLISGVLVGTSLEAGAPVLKFFGNWRWEFRMERARWEREIVPIVKPRIIALYERGLIRYGSW